MTANDAEAQAVSLMAAFADRTGLSSGAEPQRYLWTDAFAVLNLLSLAHRFGDQACTSLAKGLMDQVHRVLGRHRADEPRDGWLSGLPGDEGARHPTAGGLRIGKSLPERGAQAPADERLEWERDGQYFHYLTKWVDTLTKAAIALDDTEYHRYAVELAEAVLPPFLRHDSAGRPVGICWKMSIDLTRPQVAGVNPHDALDGYVTWRQLSQSGTSPALDSGTEILRGLVQQHGRYLTDDSLGLGGLLMDAARLLRMPGRAESDDRIAADVLMGVDTGLEHWLRQRAIAAPASHRLAFRELGLVIGLQTLPEINAAVARDRLLAGWCGRQVASLQARQEIATAILEFWRQPAQQASIGWRAHGNINDVMLCTALLQAYCEPARG